MKNMKLFFRNNLIVLSLLVLVGCGEFEVTHSDGSDKSMDDVELPNEPLSIIWASSGKRIPDQIKLEDPSETTTYVNGEKIKGTSLPIEEYIKDHGKITLRAGKDFFADWSIELDVKDLAPNSTIKLTNFNTDAKTENKKPGDNLPMPSFLNKVKGTLRTGEMSALGMPVQMYVEAKGMGKSPYIISGQGFATIGDIKVIGNKLDKHHDSFKTIDIVARDFMKAYEKSGPFESRHVTFSSDKNVGVEALKIFSYLDEKKQEKLIRLQLLKKEQGWEVTKSLKPWELQYSRKVGSKKFRHELDVAASETVEALLKKDGINNHLDTNVRCNQSKDKTKGLCTAKITILKDNEKQCLNKAYSLSKQIEWKVDKEVATNLKLDYKTGELVEKKSKKKSFQEKLLSSAAGMMFGDCNRF